MRLGDLPCGCESRKEVMFTAGKLGLPEAAIMAAAAAAIIIAIYTRRTPDAQVG